MRRDYTVAMEITPTAPLTHGSGSDGNVQVLRTMEYVVDEPDPERPGKVTPRRLRVPCVSGASFKATLREHAFGHMAEVLGLQDGQIDRDKLRLLLKGGKNDAGGQTVNLDEVRRLRDLYPLLAVFGSMDGGMPVRGEVQVSQVTPWVAELVDAHLLPRTLRPIRVVGDDLVSGAEVPLFAERTPIPLALVTTETTYYRHDLRTSPHAHYLDGPTQAAIEDKAAARSGKIATKEERREANESMPHSFEAIAPGVPLYAEIRLAAATIIEWECLKFAIARWVAHGARLGGGLAKGHGSCQVRIAGALEHAPGLGVSTAPGTAIAVDGPSSAYVEHLRGRADAIRADLLVSKDAARGAKKGAKTEAAADAG